MSPHSCLTPAFQVQALAQWDQQPGLYYPDAAERQESQPLQLTPLPSIQLASSFPLFSSIGLEHIFDSDSDVDALQPWAQAPVRQPGRPIQAVQARQPSLPTPRNNMTRSTATSSADAGAAVAQLKQKQRLSDQDHLRSYLAQLSDVQHTLRERAALAATLSDAAASTHHSNPAEDNTHSDDYSSVDEEDDERQEEEYIIRPAKRPNTDSNRLQLTDNTLPARSAAAAASPSHQLMQMSGQYRQAEGPVTAAAADNSFESTLRYLAQLSDVQATLHQNATLAATQHLPHSAAAVPGAPVPAAATAAGPGSPVQGRKRIRSTNQGSAGPYQAGAAAAASVGSGSSASAPATGIVVNIQQVSDMTGSVAALPQSSFRGVEYLPADKKWQAYVYDSTIGEVVFLDKYAHELDAALAHDRELVKRLGATAAQQDLNFSHNVPTQAGVQHTSAPTAVENTQLPAVSGSDVAVGVDGKEPTSGGGGGGGGDAPGSSSVDHQQLAAAAAAAWAAAHEAAANALVPESNHKGVEYLPAERKWQAYILDAADNQVVWLNKYDDETQAAEAHDAAIINKLGAAAALAARQINFPANIPAAVLLASQEQQHQREQTLPDTTLPPKPLQLHGLDATAAAAGDSHAQAAVTASGVAPGSVEVQGRSAATRGSGRRAARGRESKPVSQYKGVSWSSSCHKWAAVIWDRVSKKARHVGVYSSEEEAARAYDLEVIATQGAKNTGLNFRDSVDRYRAEVGEPPAPAVSAGTAAAKPNSSEYRGVSWHERSKRWEVSEDSTTRYNSCDRSQG